MESQITIRKWTGEFVGFPGFCYIWFVFVCFVSVFKQKQSVTWLTSNDYKGEIIKRRNKKCFHKIQHNS